MTRPPNTAIAAEELWLAIERKRRQGFSFAATDKREAFRAYVNAGSHLLGNGNGMKSARQMGRDLDGITGRQALSLWMKADFPAIHAAMTAKA